MAYLPERKKSNLKSGRVFKYNNARERDTEREREGGNWKRVGGSAKSVPSVRLSAATNELQCVIKHPTKTTRRRREDEMAEAAAAG